MANSDLKPIQSDNLDGILYDVIHTDDGWDITLTHLRPKVHNPDVKYPFVAVHGFCQNRKAYKTGKFTTHLIDNGIDVYLLELRGHGKSSVENQPAGAKYDWCFDHYVAYDIPAALNHVKKKAGKDQVFLCGHSLGGMLGYATLPFHDEIRALVSMGAPAQLNKEHRLIKLLSNLDWLVDPPIAGQQYWERFDKVPINAFLSGVKLMFPLIKHASFFPNLWKRENVNEDELKILFGEGGSDESTRLVAQLLRWINKDEFKSYSDLNGFSMDIDYRAGFNDIHQPILLVMGDEDRFATPRNTQHLKDSVRGPIEELVVHSTNHLGLTMGLSTENTCPRIVEFLKKYS